MAMFERIIYMILVVSPLVYLTGGVEHVTPLSIANYLNLPSLSFINYLAFLFLFACLIFGALKDLNKLIPIVVLVIFMVAILFRENSIKGAIISIVSQLLIVTPVFILIGSKFHIKTELLKKIVNLYLAYLMLSILLHYLFLSYYMLIGTYLPNERAVGIFKNPNHLAAFAVLTLILFYQLALQGFYSKNKVFIVEIMIAFVIYIAGSRSGQLFFIALILLHAYIYNRRMFLKYTLLGLLGVVIILTSDVGIEKIESLLTKRATADIQEAGNMRITILLEMLRNFSLPELLFGKGSGEGTALYITSQAASFEKIVWLDSNINTLTYTYGPFFTAFIFIGLVVRFFYKYGKGMSHTYSLLFLMYFMWFFNIGEYFPIIFMLLLSVLNEKGSHCK